MNNLSELEPVKLSLGKLTLRLFVVLVYSMLLPVGFGITLLSQGFVLFGAGGAKMDTTGFIVGIVISTIGSILLGLVLNRGWRGLFAGIFGVVWVLVLLVFSLDRIPVPMLLPGGINIEFVAYNLDFIPKLLPLNNTIQFALISVGTCIIVLIASGSVKRSIQFSGLILGVLVGYLLEFLILSLPTYWGGGGTGAFLPYVCISAVFFPELIGGQVGRRGIWVWLAFMLISFLILTAINVVFRLRL